MQREKIISGVVIGTIVFLACHFGGIEIGIGVIGGLISSLDYE